MANPRFEPLHHDVTYPLYVEVEQIINLVCPASPIHYQHYQLQSTKTSVIGAGWGINMLGLTKRLGVPTLSGLAHLRFTMAWK